MQFTPHEVEGRPVLLAEGRIDEAMLAPLHQALAEQGTREIWLRSPGGDHRAALEAGRLIRAFDAKTRIPAGWTCAAACTYMFMGGTGRTVEAGGYFMLAARADASARAPAATTEGLSAQSLNRIARRAALAATDQINFLLRMGVSTRLLSEVAFRLPVSAGEDEPSPGRCLTPAELREYRVTHDPDSPGIRRPPGRGRPYPSGSD